MYEFLKILDENINSRYLTMMRNARSSANSFYDSYLDLLEKRYLSPIKRQYTGYVTYLL